MLKANDVVSAIVAGQFTADDLRAISTAMQFHNKQMSSLMTAEFHVNQQVKWTGRKGPQTGKIIKVNRLRCKVLTPSGMVWNVPATMLRNA